MISSDGYYDDSLTLEEATLYLRERLWEFPFNDRKVMDPAMPVMIDSRSQAVQVAAMFSQFGADLIGKNELRLGFIYNANTQRSGKSLLAKLAITPTNGHMATQGWNPKDEELRKVLDAEVMRGARYIVFDNARGHVASPVLEAFMTTPVWTGRVLKETRMFEASNLATVFITGNDMTVSPDIANRCLLCDLFVSEVNVQDRVVTAPISDAWLMEWKNRHAILSALWGIIRYWDEAGHPLATENLRPGYMRWCQVFGGLTLFAGFGDCLAMPSEVESDVNTEMSDMKGLVRKLSAPLLRTIDPERVHEYFFQDVVNAAHDGGYFDWMLEGKEDQDATGRSNYVLKQGSDVKFGRLLRRYAPRIGVRAFRITPTVTIRMRSTGKDRHRRFIIERAE
jgi:hypothetical protein